MAERTLVENVAQVKADFKSIRDGFGEYFDSIYDEPTSAYGNYPFHTYNRGKGEGITQGIEQGKQEVISNSKYIEKSASGKVIRLDDVSEVAHKVVVKADTPTEVKVYGRNFISDAVYDYSNWNAWGKHTKFLLNAPTIDKYTISGKTTAVDTVVALQKSNDNGVTYSNVTTNIFDSSSYTFSVEEGYEYVLQATEASCNQIYEIQLEIGSTATEYEPYKGQTITVTPDGTEASSICPTMTFLADSDVTVDYFGSYGMQTEYDRFWDNYQNYGKRTNYAYAFCQTGWTDTNFLPKYDITLTSAAQMFYNSKITDLAGILKKQGVVMDSSKATSVTYTYGYSSLTRIPVTDLSSATNTTYFCAGDTRLVSIEKIISSEKTVFANNAFNNCTALEHCIFEGTISSDINLQWSKKLSLESGISLLECLYNYHADDATGTPFTKTVTLPPEVWDLLDEHYGNSWEYAMGKGWNVA